MIVFGEKALRRVISQYLKHYHTERNHRGLDNNLIESTASAAGNGKAVECRERLGGILKYYYFAA